MATPDIDLRHAIAAASTAPKAEADDFAVLLLAYRVGAAPPLPLIPATRERGWIEATRGRFANRCLPLLIANQAGWFVLNSHAMTVTWDGSEGKDALRLVWKGDPPYPAVSHFGHGILTWHIPYLFRTPPGWNLLVRGPASWPKHGIAPLEGLVEADWAVATFTMNWKLTAVEQPVRFEQGEPICMLVPQRRGELESFVPEVRELAVDPTLAAAHRAWTDSRSQFLDDLKAPDSAAVKQGWQRDYFHGAAPDGTRAIEHQTKLRLRPFAGRDGICPPGGMRPPERRVSYAVDNPRGG